MADPTVFAGARFSRVWAEACGLEWEPLDGHPDCGLVFSESRRFGVRDYELAPRGLYWGGSAELVESAARHCLERRTAGITWSFRHDAEEELVVLRRAVGDRGCRVVESATQVIAIDGRSYEELFRGTFRTLTRRKIRRAEDAGLRIRPLTSEAELDEHDALYRRWASGRGVEPHPAQLFCGLVQEIPDSAVLFGAFDEGALSAAVLIFRDDREWFYWHGLRDAERDRHNAIDALLAHAVRDACEAGVQSFNLGASAGIASIEDYKQRWGAERRPVWTVRWTDAVWSPVIEGWQRLRRHTAGER